MGQKMCSCVCGAVRATALFASVVAGVALTTGCQLQPAVSTSRLIHHQQLVESDGLDDAATFDALRAQCAPPQHWTKLPLQRSALFTHQQWKSPTASTGVGVAYVKMPLPLSAKTIIWFAKGEYQKKDKDQSGKQLGQWTDALGREWFEAENSKFHVRGCVMTRGFEAWIIYTGYKLSKPMQEEEINLAMRAQEKILPLGPEMPPTKTATASAD
jgi:hypothetical protein